MRVPRSHHRPALLAGKIFAGRDALRCGLLTKSGLRSKAWRHLFRGVYADARIKVTHLRRSMAAGWYLLPASAALAGRSAATIYGITIARPTDPIDVVVPAHDRFGTVDGLRIHVGELPAEDVRVRADARVTTPLRTCWDLANWLDPVEAVVYIDAMLSWRLVRRNDLVAYGEARANTRGVRAFERAVALADPGAESPQESRLRARLVLAGVPRPVTQYVIERAGAFVARVDLAWPDCRVAVEYDGVWHAGSDEQIHHDRQRLNELVATGEWVVLHVTARRLRDDFDGFVREFRTALQAGSRSFTE